MEARSIPADDFNVPEWVTGGRGITESAADLEMALRYRNAPLWRGESIETDLQEELAERTRIEAELAVTRNRNEVFSVLPAVREILESEGFNPAVVMEQPFSAERTRTLHGLLAEVLRRKLGDREDVELIHPQNLQTRFQLSSENHGQLCLAEAGTDTIQDGETRRIIKRAIVFDAESGMFRGQQLVRQENPRLLRSDNQELDDVVALEKSDSPADILDILTNLKIVVESSVQTPAW